MQNGGTVVAIPYELNQMIYDSSRSTRTLKGNKHSRTEQIKSDLAVKEVRVYPTYAIGSRMSGWPDRRREMRHKE